MWINMILVDFNGMLYQNLFGSITACQPEIQEDGKYLLKDFMPTAKAFLLDNLFNIQQEYQYTYGPMTICLDNTKCGNWRKEHLTTYKSSRAEGREESEIPFDKVFEDVDKLVYQLKENTPYKVVSVETAEADDVILCLAKQYAKKENVLIISSDKDMIQAQRHGNVKQFSPMTKKWITPETKGGDMNLWLQEHIILGDTADEVPRITDRTEFTISFKNYLKVNKMKYTPKTYNKLSEEKQEKIEDKYDVLDRWGRKDIWKQPRLGPVKIQKILDEGKLDEFLDSNELYRENYERNKRLVLDDYIPTNIYNKSIENYINAKTEINGKNSDEFVKYLNGCGLGKLALNLPLNFTKGSFSMEDF